MRALYTLRPLLAGLLHHIGQPGALGYSAAVTASISERSLLDTGIGVAIFLGYIAVAAIAGFRLRWLVWVSSAVFLLDQLLWVARSFDHQYNADHAAAGPLAGFGMDLVDWSLFALELAIFALALHVGLSERENRRLPN